MSNSKSDTLYASPERIDQDELIRQIDAFEHNALVKKAFDASNIMILAINGNRQIVFANSTFQSLLGTDSSRFFLGKRAGEAINCIHSKDHINGCGTSEACRYCNCVNLVLKAMNSGSAISGDAVVTIESNGIMLPMNIFENVTPFELYGETFYIVTLMDISDAKWRRVLERVFFHDVLNTSGALRGLISLLKGDVPGEYRPEVEFVEQTFSGLIDDVITQRQLMEAENNDLQIDSMTLRSDEVVHSVVKLYKNHEAAREKFVEFEESLDAAIFKSDLSLIKRILGNMVKNALEASDTGETVRVGCKKIVSEAGDRIEFWVNNRKMMPRSVQLQVFQRSFSTKGTGRGLGTYSMKLLGERYLKGEVDFTVDEVKGTTFYLRLKLSHD